MSGKLDCTSAPFVRWGKKSRLILSLATLVARNANTAMVAPMVGSGGVCIWREYGVWTMAVGFVLVRLAGIWLQSPWRCFHVLIYCIKTFHKCCTFNAICKDNAAINCISFRHKKKGSFPSTLTGHTTLVVIIMRLQIFRHKQTHHAVILLGYNQ
jgi:hypothetical protein